MKKIRFTIVISILTLISYAQKGYEIKVDLKNYKDDIAYLAYYQFDKTFVKDTCSSIKNGKIIFNGTAKLDTGIYSLVGKKKNILFNFFVDDETQQLELISNAENDFNEDLYALNSARQNEFFKYIRYFSEQNSNALNLERESVLLTKSDSLEFNKKREVFAKNLNDYERNFLINHKETYIGSVLNLKIEKVLNEFPKNSSGLPDSIVAFNYYKKHYWNDVNFGDDAVMRNPFFYSKLRRYFEEVVPIQSDSICDEIDTILAKTNTEGILYKTLLAYFTKTYETSPIMGFDKIFVHIIEKYYKTGKSAGIYSEDVVKRLVNRAETLKPLLLGSIAPELTMIKAEDFYKMEKLGFENGKSGEEITNLYYKNLSEITKMYVKLTDVKADYTILVFWDPDCSHCQVEIPILLSGYNELIRQNTNVKVYSVSMEFEGEKYLKYIAGHKLPWINVYDGARVNNVFQKYDVFSTPVIYILDKNKVIKAKRIGAEKVKEIITSLDLVNR